jgi:hypothetical protein
MEQKRFVVPTQIADYVCGWGYKPTKAGPDDV